MAELSKAAGKRKQVSQLLKTNQQESNRVETANKPLKISEVWNKHLHYPKIEKGTKRIRGKEPLVIVSKKWKEYNAAKNKEKEAKEQAKEKKKAERQRKQLVKNMPKLMRKYVKKKGIKGKTIADKIKIKDNKNNNDESKQVKKKKYIKNASDESSDDSYTLGELRQKMQKTSEPGIYRNDKSCSDGSVTSSSECDESENKKIENNSLGVSVTDFVIVKYKEQHYSEVVVGISLLECEVRVMHKAENNTWKWPKKVDQIWYKNEDIVDKIEVPVLTSEKSNLYVVSAMNDYCNL